MLEEFISARQIYGLPEACLFTRCLFEFQFKKTENKEDDCRQASECRRCKKHCGEVVFNGLEIAFSLEFKKPTTYYSRKMIEVIPCYNGECMDCSTVVLRYKDNAVFLNSQMTKKEVIESIKTQLLK